MDQATKERGPSVHAKNRGQIFHGTERTSEVNNWFTISANKLLQICSQVVSKLCSHCLFPCSCKKFGTSCQQLVTSLIALSDLLRGCSNKSDTALI